MGSNLKVWLRVLVMGNMNSLHLVGWLILDRLLVH